MFIGTNLQFSNDAYYYTLSSVFQGLFSILALAGIFVLFRIEQLSKDVDKYETDFKEYLREIKNQTIPDLSSIGFLNPHASKDIMEWNEHNAILSLLGKREFTEYSNELDKLENKFAKEDKKFEEELNKLKLEIEKKGKNGGFAGLTSPLFQLDIEDIENYRKEEIDAIQICINHVKECKEKGDHIKYNISVKNKILNFFLYPFILGMILILFTIFFLPMLNSNSEFGFFGFWFEKPFRIESSLIVGLLVSFTIMVILTIMLVIYYSMFSDEAKKTLGLYR